METVKQEVIDNVNNPKHYKIFPGMEVIDVIRTILTKEQFIGYLIGNVLKYRLRAGHKNDTLEDISKAKKYEEWLAKEVDAQKCGSITIVDPSFTVPSTIFNLFK